ncbi:MAG: hypothetical protein RDV41_04835 [Planctomycetota bacterium]|nr:hypothetical protein [Planctomycetota bacterium]
MADFNERRNYYITGALLALVAASVALAVWASTLFRSLVKIEKDIPGARNEIVEMGKVKKLVQHLRDSGARRKQIDPLQFHETLSTILKQIRPGLTPTKVTQTVNPRLFNEVLQEIGHQIEMTNVSREEFGKMIFYLEKNLPGLKAKDINIPKWSNTDLNRLDKATVLMVYYVPVK